MLTSVTLRAILAPWASSTLASASIATVLPVQRSRATFSTSQQIRANERPSWMKNVYQRHQTPLQTIRKTEDTIPAAIAKPRPSRLKCGTVVSVGRMDRTVTVHERSREWDKHIRKFYPKINKFLVSDPRNSLLEGDIIEFSSGSRKSRRVRHVVERIVAPFGMDISDRPAVMTVAEREAEREIKRSKKDQRRLEKARELLRAGEGGEEDVKKFEELWNNQAGTVRIGRIKGLVKQRLALAEERRRTVTAADNEVLP